MSTQNWQKIWERRSCEGVEQLDLATLIKLDGFDTGAGRIESTDWQAYAEIIAKKLRLKNGDSVYELGCGAGAFLYALRQLYTLKLGGLDYSSALIDAASRAMPDGDFVVKEAKAVKIEPAYDYVISNGVFHYFNYDYAAEVVASMIKKSKIAVAIMEIPDMQTKQQAEALRRDALSVEVYEKKYAGLEHTYYERDWFDKQAALHGCTCEAFDGCVPNYAQNQFRFGVLIKKA